MSEVVLYFPKGILPQQERPNTEGASQGVNQMILARKAINHIDVLEKLQAITIPSLIIVGAEFGQWFIEINRKIADSLPNSEFVVLEQSMDPSNLVNPVEFDRQVLRFLKKDLA